MKINFELEIGPETAVVSSALEDKIRLAQDALSLGWSPPEQLKQIQTFLDVAKRLELQLETTISAACQGPGE